MNGGKKLSKNSPAELTKSCDSSFTLTFVVEVVGIDVFHDCNEGWIDLTSGPIQGIKLQYQLAPGQNFTIDVIIWPHTAKIWFGNKYTWVRTWFYLQRRWLAFSINHAFPVRVMDYRHHIASVTPTFGQSNINARNERFFEVYLPKVPFGVRRQFASVVEAEINLEEFILDLIWSSVTKYIPASYLDAIIDTPQPVTDKRHQDAVIFHVQDIILNHELTEKQSFITTEVTKGKEAKDKKKPAEEGFEIKLSGHTIISGTGRVIPFETFGEKPQGTGEVITLIASNGLPAPDDNPVVFVNIGQLTDLPINELTKRNITEIYTKWTIADEEFSSEPQSVSKGKDVNLNDHHAVPLSTSTAAYNINEFLDNTFQIELRGIRSQSPISSATFFGYAKGDRDFGTSVPPKLSNRDADVLIGVTKIDARSLSRKANAIIRGEYPVYPIEVSVKPLEREGFCTNDINAVRAPVLPDKIVPTSVILEAQMTLEVSIGVVGCKAEKMPRRYSRLYTVVSDNEAIMTILRCITEINEQVMETGKRDDLLTGFALDVGVAAMLYVEGPRDKEILLVWDKSADFFPKMKPAFSTSDKYRSRVYSDLCQTAMPFIIMKMFVPISILLACPPIYARPALPLPTRFAVLKLGRLLATKHTVVPRSNEMPTMRELRSLKLELCVAPRPPLVANLKDRLSGQGPAICFKNDAQNSQRIIWKKTDKDRNKDFK